MQIKPGYLVGYILEGKHQIAVVQAVQGNRVVVEGGELLIADLVPTVLEICVMDGSWNQVQKK